MDIYTFIHAHTHMDCKLVGPVYRSCEYTSVAVVRIADVEVHILENDVRIHGWFDVD